MDKFVIINGYYFSKVNLFFGMVDKFFAPYCIYMFFGHFMERRIRNKKWHMVLLIFIYTLLRRANDITFSILNLPFDIGLIIEMLVSVCINLLIAFCFYKAPVKITIFTIITFDVIEKSSGMFRVFFPAISVQEYVVSMLISYLLLRYIVKKIYIKDFINQKIELIVLIIPSLLGFFINILLYIIMHVLVENKKAVFEKSPVLYGVILIILLLTQFSIIHGISMCQNMYLLNREKNNRILLEKQIESMQQYTTEIERIWTGIRSLKHDMRNILCVITSFLTEDTREEQVQLKEYISGLQENLKQLEIRFRTGNAVADTLIGMKYQEAKRELPDLKLDIDMLFFPEGLMVKSYDIGMILGNAMDNALEACRELKENNPEAELYVRIHSCQKKKNVFYGNRE